MPKRPKSHQIADTAVTRVSRVFHAAGFVCERNIGDYGEDLIVQPIHQDVVDPFKMYVQVKALGKGTRGGARSRSNFTRTFPRDHIRKWIRSPELVIVAFWLERSDVIYFAVPARQWTEWRLHEFPRSAIPIVIRIQDVLTTESAVQLAWGARIRNLNRMFLNALSWTSDPEASPQQKESEEDIRQREIVALTIHFLEMIGFAEQMRSGARRTRGLTSTAEELAAEASDITTAGLSVEEVALTLILYRIARLAPGYGVPEQLLSHSMLVLGAMIVQGTELERDFAAKHTGGVAKDMKSGSPTPGAA